MGLYVHVPFCAVKCGYCAFHSVPIDAGLVRDYADALREEIRLTAGDPSLEGRTFATLYVGGGTPSALPGGALESLLGALFEACSFREDPEVTVEANPESFGDDLASLLGSLPGGRLSLGAQSFRPEVLRTLGRRHDPGAVGRSVERARAAGVENVALDLIYGAPGETARDWEASLRAAVQLKPQHISCYCLSVERGTPLAEMIRAGRLRSPDETAQRDMYDAARAMLAGEGYEHYEVSSFALPGWRSEHNMGYWRRGEYLGLGPSAHSFIGGARRRNCGDVAQYCARLRAGSTPVDRSEKISRRQSLEEAIMLGMRTFDGVDLEEVAESWGEGTAEELRRRAAPLVEAGAIEMDGAVMRVQASRYFVSDDIVARLLLIPDRP